MQDAGTAGPRRCCGARIVRGPPPVGAARATSPSCSTRRNRDVPTPRSSR